MTSGIKVTASSSTAVRKATDSTLHSNYPASLYPLPHPSKHHRKTHSPTMGDSRRLPPGSQAMRAVLSPYTGGPRPDETFLNDPIVHDPIVSDPIYQAYKVRLPPAKQMRQASSSPSDLQLQQMLIDQQQEVSLDQQQRMQAMRQGGPAAVAALGQSVAATRVSDEHQDSMERLWRVSLGDQWVARLNGTYGTPAYGGGADVDPSAGQGGGSGGCYAWARGVSGVWYAASEPWCRFGILGLPQHGVESVMGSWGAGLAYSCCDLNLHWAVYIPTVDPITLLRPFAECGGLGAELYVAYGSLSDVILLNSHPYKLAKASHQSPTCIAAPWLPPTSLPGYPCRQYRREACPHLTITGVSKYESGAQSGGKAMVESNHPLLRRIYLIAGYRSS